MGRYEATTNDPLGKTGTINVELGGGSRQGHGDMGFNNREE